MYVLHHIIIIIIINIITSIIDTDRLLTHTKILSLITLVNPN